MITNAPNRGSRSLRQHPLLRPIPLSKGGAWLLGLTLTAMVLLWWFDQGRGSAWAYERHHILDGQWWRLLTAHLVHWDGAHVVVNVLGALLMLRLFAGTYSLRQWVVIVVTAALFIGLGFLWLDPQQRGYVGASGVLHGVLAAGMVRWWRTEQRFDAVLLTLILVGKLVWEQSQGSLPLSGAMPVAIDAHLYGAVGGFCSAGCLEWLAYRRREQSSRAPL